MNRLAKKIILSPSLWMLALMVWILPVQAQDFKEEKVLCKEKVLFDPTGSYGNGSTLTSENTKLVLGNDRAKKNYDLKLSSVKAYCAELFGQTVMVVNEEGVPEEKTRVAYVVGGNNPKDGELGDDDKSAGGSYNPDKMNLPNSGTYFMITPATGGHITAFIVLNADKAFFVVKSNGEALPQSAITIKGDGETPTVVKQNADNTINEKTTGTVDFDVVGGETYYVFCNGSKLNFGGYLFTYEGDAPPTSYLAISENGKVVTFYHDNQKGERKGTIIDLEGYEGLDIDSAALVTEVVFDSSFADARPNSMRQWFKGMANLTTINGTEHLNTSETTDMYHLFHSCAKLTSIDLSHFNASKVTDMHSMFYGCEGLTTLNLSNFNTSNVTTMYCMFNSCSKLASLNLGSFDTSKVTTMYGMFNECTNLKTLDVSNFNTSKVTNMYAMFNECTSLKTLDVSNFNTSKDTNTSSMFNNCTGLENLTLSSTLDNLNDNACNGVGTEDAPCLITAPEGFDFGVETSGSFLWKSGWFTFGHTNPCFLTVESMSLRAGSTANLPIDLTIDREEQYNGFQFDITLPEGITLVKNGDKYTYSLGDRYSNDMQVSFNELGINQWRVMVFSLNNALLTGLNGEAITLAVEADKSISETVYTGSISNIRLSNIDGKSLTLPSMVFDIQVAQYQPLYCEAEPLRPNMTSNMSIYLSIDNEDLYNGYQFDITLPEGVTLAKDSTSYAYTLANRYTDAMRVNFNEIDENDWRVMVYSLTNAMLTGLEGEIITLSIAADENIPNDNLSGVIANFRLSRIDGKSIPLTDVTFNFQVDSSSSFKMGDANHDGEVDVSDVMLTVYKSLIITVSDFYMNEADINKDGIIDIIDVMSIVNITLGKKVV